MALRTTAAARQRLDRYQVVTPIDMNATVFGTRSVFNDMGRALGAMG
jgi:hypothetical protein